MIVGVDVGTGSTKAVVLDDALQVRGKGRSFHLTSYPQPGWAEQDARVWEASLGPAIAEALTAAGMSASDVKSVGVTGQLDGCLAVDLRGRPFGPCLIWMDRRADETLESIRTQISAGEMRARTGLNLDGGHMAPKIRWLLQHAPNASAFGCFHQPVSYMVERLTGRRVMDHGLASTTLLYDVAAGAWADDLFDVFGVPSRLLPSLAAADEVAGALNRTGASLTGLPEGVPVTIGTGDDFAAPLGAGIVGAGVVVDVLGTAEVVGALDGRLLVDETGLLETHRFPAATGSFYVENPGWVSGGAVEWMRTVLSMTDPAELDALAGTAPSGSDGLLFLPALTGAMAPAWIPAARACFYGLTPSHGAAHLARAVLEGTAFGLRDMVTRLRAMTVEFDRVRAVGGGGRSELWCQIRADVTGLPVERAAEVDAAAVGAGLLGAVAAGLRPSLTDAAREVGTIAQTHEPVAERTAVYDEAYARYGRLFNSLEPMFEDRPGAG